MAQRDELARLRVLPSPAQTCFSNACLIFMTSSRRKKKQPRGKFCSGPFTYRMAPAAATLAMVQVLQAQRALSPRVAACSERVPRRERQSIGSAIPVESSIRCGSRPGARSRIWRRFDPDGQDPRSARRPCALSSPPRSRSPNGNSAARQQKSIDAGHGSDPSNPRLQTSRRHRAGIRIRCAEEHETDGGKNSRRSC